MVANELGKSHVFIRLPLFVCPTNSASAAFYRRLPFSSFSFLPALLLFAHGNVSSNLKNRRRRRRLGRASQNRHARHFPHQPPAYCHRMPAADGGVDE